MNHNIRKLSILVIVVMFLLIPATYADNNENSDYSIYVVVKQHNITKDGTVHIKEDVNYTFQDNINSLSRFIPISGNQSISNISVETPGFYNKIEVENKTNGVKIKVLLYTDEARTQYASGDNARIIYNYNLNNGVKMYNDVAEYKYMPWGSEWEKGVFKLQTYLTIPGNYTGVELWNNPSYKVVNSSLSSFETYKTNYKIINDGETVEQRILIPKEYFNSTENMEVINQDAKLLIEKSQAEYQDSIVLNTIISYILLAISVILIASPAVIYYKWIKEPSISYDSKYETEIPVDDDLLLVNALVNGEIGEIDTNGLNAIILNLYYNGYIEIYKTSNANVSIKITETDWSNLQKNEQMILEYLSKLMDENHVILLNEININKFYKNWKKTVEDTYYTKINQYYHHKGSYYSLIYGLITVSFIIISATLMIFVLKPYVPIEDWIFRAIIALIPESIIMLILNKTIQGQWTKKGKYFNEKWKSYEYYITDYSLVTKYPPESMDNLSLAIIYATALGQNNMVNKVIKQYFNEHESEIISSSTNPSAFALVDAYELLYPMFKGNVLR